VYKSFIDFLIKGTVPRDFRRQVFYLDQFSPSPWFYHKDRFGFFRNSRRYSQLKVRKKSSIRKICIISFGHLWVVELAFRNFFFFFKFILSCQQSDNCSHCLPRCRLHQWQICRRCRWYRWQFATGVADTGGKFATGINNLPPVSTTLAKLVAKFAARVICRCCEYLREFSKKFETVLTGYSGAGGKLIHEKTRSKKSRDTVPLRSVLTSKRLLYITRVYLLVCAYWSVEGCIYLCRYEKGVYCLRIVY
jgi:hypothetical protein